MADTSVILDLLMCRPPGDAAQLLKGAHLAHVATALAAGEPGRAIRLLDDAPAPTGDLGSVTLALRAVAATLSGNWFPGGTGAVVDPAEPQPTPITAPRTLSADASALVTVAVELLAPLPTWRSILHAAPDAVLQSSAAVARDLAATGVPVAAGAAALVHADLTRRAGRPATTAEARRSYADDPLGLAACALVEGDWAATPGTYPDTLGEDLGDGSAFAASAGPPDRALAAERYREAGAGFTAAGSARGVAAVTLRQAELTRSAGRPDRALAGLDRARTLAEEAGDGALVCLATVHRALAGIEAGEQAAPGPIGDEVGGWAATVGSRSYGRGLVRLCLARARRWRQGDVLRGRQALMVAAAINEHVGGAAEADMIAVELTDYYRAANFRRAALALLSLDVESGDPADPVAWMKRVDRAMMENREASGLQDPDAIARSAGHMARLADRTPDGPSAPMGDIVRSVRQILAQAVSEADVLVPLYRGVATRGRGEQLSAEREFAAALAAVRALGTGHELLQAVVLGTTRRRAEALAAIKPMVDTGRLARDHAASLFVRLGAYTQALALITAPRTPGDPPSGPPWEAPAQLAEVLVGLDRPAEAVPHAELAISRFETHLAGLSRDVLRGTALDDVVIAGMYTSAVTAHAAIALGGGGSAPLERAFQLSDRCRGLLLSDLLDTDRAAGADAAVVSAVRTWLRAGATLARTVEELTEQVRVEIRRAVLAAERAVDDAEAGLAATAPALLARRRQLPPTPGLREIQDRLDPGTLLLQYHAFNDELVAWAITRGDRRVVRLPSVTPALTGDVRRFHTAVANRASTAEERATLGRPLGELLLDPFADELRELRRLVVVPYGPLSVLPFHVLPWRGDVLASTHVVSYLPAASVLPAASRARRVGRDADALVLGNPAYAADRGLRDLPGAAVEARAVGAMRGVDALVGTAADRVTVLDRMRAANVVHLATHGLLHEGAPYSAELALTGGQSLTIPDLMGLDTTVDLAVLSACDSGRGRATAAGDVIGLTRSLLAAGAQELVVSLWPVDDRLGCLLMVRFQRALLEGLDPATAASAASGEVRHLSRIAADAEYAALAGREPPSASAARGSRDIDPDEAAGVRTDDPAHPYYWAPFVHVGG